MKRSNLREVRRRAITVVIFVVLMLFATNSFAQFAGGNGSEAAPWQVNSAAHLQLLRNYIGAQHADKYFIQTADIDIGGITNWDPVATATATRFHGKYNGDNYEIRNLRRTGRLSSFGFFGYCGDGCVLENIKLRNVNVLTNSHSGVLACQATGTEIKNCSITGVAGTMNMIQGGMVGTFTGNGNIHRCWVNLTITDGGSGGRTAGLVGDFTSTGSITESFAIVDLTWRGGNPPAGGLVARITSGSISNCYAIGIIREIEDRGRVGGFVGDNSGRPITNCYAIVSIETDTPNPIGGFIAQGAAGNVTNCYWNHELTGLPNSPGGGEPLTTGQMLDRDNFVRWDFEGDDPIWRIDEGSIPYLAFEGDEAPEHCCPPTALPPSSLTGTATTDVVRLTWERPSITPPLGYNVYRDDRQINQNLVEEEEYRDNTVECYNNYDYYVTAVYDDDAESAPSNTVNIVVHDLEGGGTANNPYQIANESQLNVVRYLLDAHFIQTADIDLHRQAWVPIGADNARFRGTYDGDGFRIIEMNINSTTNYRGFFGYVEGATLRNITLEDVDLRMGQYSGALAGRTASTNITNVTVTGDIQATNTYVGGLVGYAISATNTINNCSVSGTITATSNYIGGIVGGGYITINDCTTDLEITTAGIYAGGIAGYTGSTMRINRCAVLGNITSSSTTANIFLGGLLGRSYLTYITDSYVTGNVTSSAQGGRDYVGGLVGGTYSTTYTILRCYTSGNVTGRDHVGGILGTMVSEGGNIEDCYAIGTITGVNHVGGLIGSNQTNKNVLRCYSIGRVFGETNVGGLIGSGNGTTTNSYWNTETSGQRESPGGGSSRDNRHMRYPYTEDTYVGWNFTTVWAHDVDPSWNDGYPRLHWQERPIEFIETLQVEVDIVQIDGTDHFRIRWELVDGARSYRIYSSQDPSTNDWGVPIRTVEGDVTTYAEPIEDNRAKFFYVTGSAREAR